ncbi:uncharacterized protein A1O5_10679 [Cladophialophora psammophila CBS 110553]|uniref:Uncharacterized protein n=1 Tax=Cladophialophora psammophila CBS 110553 TaxID=1182543 RepID=W9WM35_9EURO|nr:uncharacterized protein A1O5_10679 [Cladophialophora psammophila CBS 110553]EXJ66065.1 hypothetical protein A1O5_10679 [Cladophialophora psammophila CBS 110553]
MAKDDINGTKVQIDQTVQIVNMSEFNKYTQTALLTKEYHVFLKGSGALHKRGLPSVTVDYDKIITLQGLNGLAGFNVTSFDIIDPPLPNGSNIPGTVSIPNPSFPTFELGKVNMNMSVAGASIGTCSVPNVLLQPGDNTFPMIGVANQSAIAGLVLGLFKPGIVPIDVVGTQVLYNEENIPWYEQALQGLMLRLDLDVTGALQEFAVSDARWGRMQQEVTLDAVADGPDAVVHFTQPRSALTAIGA